MPTKKKIAILGGGMGALSAAFWLTENPNWQKEYDIDVYQLGWRLGGKGASGRNLDAQCRIEEHGLHLWAGFYENAFRTMRKCYEALNRPAGQPLATIDEAIKKQPFLTLMEYVDGQWIPWNINSWDPSFSGGMPGADRPLPFPKDYLRLLVKLVGEITRAIEAHLNSLNEGPSVTGVRLSDIAGGLRPLERFIWHELLERVIALGERIFTEPSDDRTLYFHLLTRLQEFADFMWARLGGLLGLSHSLRRFWIMLDISIATLVGMIKDEVDLHGFDVINRYDWGEWLRQHGIKDVTFDSALVRGVYDTFFAYCQGDTSGGGRNRAMAAGAAAYSLMRFIFTSKGSLFWKLQAGMGETIFAPLYIVLKRRGVRFHFFRRVDSLGLSADKQQIATIKVSQQVRIRERDGGGGEAVDIVASEYDPLIDVNGLPCWPVTPRYEQILDGDGLAGSGINLESPWLQPPVIRQDTLTLGNQFDIVILGISIGAFGDICKELIDQSPAWRDLVTETATVQTQGLQLWLTPKATDLGWIYPPTVLSSFMDPLDTWGDFSHLVGLECWTGADQPKSIAYFCGPMLTPLVLPPYSDHDFPQRQTDVVGITAAEMLTRYIGILWPKAITARSGDFNWQILVDPQHRAGRERLKAQYWRANNNPSDRYVLSVPNSMATRLKAEVSGFRNLYLAGDWVYTPVNLGCMEAAAMAGMQAARAICGYPEKIIGFEDA